MEVIGDYSHIRVNHLDEAIEIANVNPEFEFDEGIAIEVRPRKMKEELTGFVYPTNIERTLLDCCHEC